MTRLTALALLLILVAGPSLSGEAREAREAREAGRTLYLTVKYSAEGVTLEDARVVDGKVKRPRRISLTPGHFYFTVTTDAGEKLYEGTVPDPTLLRVVHDPVMMQTRTDLIGTIAIDGEVRKHD
jgi:hypothetical protein